MKNGKETFDDIPKFHANQETSAEKIRLDGNQGEISATYRHKMQFLGPASPPRPKKKTAQGCFRHVPIMLHGTFM
jgi:hypothetical protein